MPTGTRIRPRMNSGGMIMNVTIPEYAPPCPDIIPIKAVTTYVEVESTISTIPIKLMGLKRSS